MSGILPHASWLLGFADGAAAPVAGPPWAGWILWLPLISLVLCGLCAAFKVRSKLPAWITVICLAGSFVVTLMLYMGYEEGHWQNIQLFQWLNLHWENAEGGEGSFVANFALHVDSLTLLWMLFVTGLGTLIALYASEYMEHDVGKGYARFFAGVSVFLFAMSSLVMADNLVMLYLGWEGVGFASYWLIGYFYTKPSAVAAAKKAFIVNRIGDLGLALAIYLIYHNFGTVEYTALFDMLRAGPSHYPHETGGWSIQAIPFLLMLGAFGKSAQLPLYVWLPDAMEGPTPVSALIHAATMVTAGVYLLCRMFPALELHPAALPTVAWIGTLTALLAATIGMAQYDMKRVMAYSTISQLGYMFAGIGVMTTFGAAYHVLTHAFFKAVLFLTCGAVMHGFAGQLDLRKVSGLRRMPGWKIVAYTMLYGCMCLAAFPFITDGFYSKDLIVIQPFLTHGPGFVWIGWILIFTAALTGYYAFRVWFRVCAGPAHFEMGEDDHGADAHEDHYRHEHAHDHKPDDAHGHAHGQPHAPRIAINFVLIAITLGAVATIFAEHWVHEIVEDCSASAGVPVEAHHGGVYGENTHDIIKWIAIGAGLAGISVAAYLHLLNRKAADSLRASLLANPLTRWLPTAMENKWYVDELYNAILVAPMWILGHVFALIDRYIIDWLLVDGIARLPKFLGRAFQPLHNGVLQSYAVSMAGGAALAIVLVTVVMPQLKPWLINLLGGGH